MEWIKRNYDQFILALVALLLLGLSGYIVQNGLQFQQTFAGINDEVPHNNRVAEVDLSGLQQSTEMLAKPVTWTSGTGSLFVSTPYIVRGTEIFDPREGTEQLHPPVPNAWIINHKLDILDNNVLNEDPDGDGFTNLDEWKNVKGDGSDSTDPQEKNSHPPYWTKLRLVQYIKQPFRLLFNAYDGDPKKPESLTFQINTVDVRQPSQFLKTGDPIAGTKFKVVKFEYKKVPNPKTGEDTDVSELTVQNTETQEDVVLILEKVVDSPDSYALFRYLWNNTQFKVKKGKQFALPPEPTLLYNVVDIKEKEALIQPPNGEPIRIPSLDQP